VQSSWVLSSIEEYANHKEHLGEALVWLLSCAWFSCTRLLVAMYDWSIKSSTEKEPTSWVCNAFLSNSNQLLLPPATWPKDFPKSWCSRRMMLLESELNSDEERRFRGVVNNSRIPVPQIPRTTTKTSWLGISQNWFWFQQTTIILQMRHEGIFTCRIFIQFLMFPKEFWYALV
jgi:hypothetical protein